MTELLIRSAADWAAFFRVRIADLGLSHFEVDQRTGLAPGYTNKIINGKKLPGAHTIEKLCRELQISLRPVVEGASENCALEDCDKPRQHSDTLEDQRSDLHVEERTGCSPVGAGVAGEIASASRQGSASAGRADPEDPARRDPGTADRARRVIDPDVMPPASKPIVLARRRLLEMERDALRADAIDLALASAKGDAGAREKLSALPAPTAKAVRDHRKKLELERDGLRTGAAELARLAALGDAEAKATLAAIPGKFAALQFEIDLNHEAYELAHKQDSDAEAAWRASLQSMDPEDLIAGINKDECCRLCQPNSPGGCVITASYPYAGSQCGHPIREKQTIFGRDENGDRRFLYERNPRAAQVFEAARRKLKVS